MYCLDLEDKSAPVTKVLLWTKFTVSRIRVFSFKYAAALFEQEDLGDIFRQCLDESIHLPKSLGIFFRLVLW